MNKITGRSSTVLACLAVPTVYLLYRLVAAWWRRRSRVKIIMQLPGDKPHWLYGHLAEYLGPNEAGLKQQREYVAKYPRLVHLWLGPFQYQVEVMHPETVKVILRSSEPKPMSMGGYRFLRPWLGDGLLLSRDRKWLRNRRLLTPAFHFDILKSYMDIYNACADDLLEIIRPHAEAGSSFEMFQVVSNLTLDVMLRCAFSYKSDCQKLGDSHPYVKAIKELCSAVVDRFLSPLIHWDWVYFKTTAGQRFKQNCDYVHSVSEDIIAKRKKTLEQQGEAAFRSSRYRDFLDILLTARDEEGVGLTDIDIRNEVDTFLFEGHDTTASSISWALFALASHPEHQRKCQEEIDALLEGRESDIIEWNDLGKLHYLTMCIKEAQRLYPVVPFIERELSSDLTLDGHVIPAGTVVDVDLYSLHHNPYIWDDTTEYRPDRFLPEKVKQMDTYAFVPFSAGPRNCIGQNFAMHEIKVAIARILHRYTLQPDPYKPTKQLNLLVMKTENGMYMEATPRS